MHMFTEAQIETAKSQLLIDQRVTTGQIQRRLRLSYSDAEAILSALQDHGVVTTKIDGVRRLAAELELPEASSRRTFVRSVFETARYFWEMWEEECAGDTRVMNLLKPSSRLKNRALRNFVLRGCFEARKMSLYEASLELVGYLSELGLDERMTDDDRAELCVMCSTAAKTFSPTTGREEIQRRAFARLARYLALRGTGAHTRCFEYFLNGAYDVPVGYGTKGDGWGEHVVPLAYIRKHCVDLIAKGGTFEAAAEEIKRLLVIVHISPEQSALLDRSTVAGGRGLRSTMPESWCPITGSIYARLEEAGIEFVPPSPS